MKPPSRMLLTQSITVFTPVKVAPPVNGGYATTYSKTIYQHDRYTITTDKVLHVVLYDVSGAIDYDSIFTEALIVPGEYTGLTPPKEGTEKHFYKVSKIHYRLADRRLHNVGVDAV